jgi:hypothetical protein
MFGLAPVFISIQLARFDVINGCPPLCGIHASTVPSTTPFNPATGSENSLAHPQLLVAKHVLQVLFFAHAASTASPVVIVESNPSITKK